ncbi:MAG: rod shape-determining protein RodA [Coriobacteriia bacterium]|nr:rod shape-determining protein RodA [Actinomycetota bacterium]MDZ4167008.1 rod shape-determining protein RodA [Coriobacteriia bacterium]
MARSRTHKSTSRRFFDVVHVPLLLWALALVVYGSVMVASATLGMDGGEGMLLRHAVGIGVGLVPLVLAWAYDYTRLRGWQGPLIALGAFLLLSPRIPGLGYTAGGATSWLAVFGVRLFQPSEPAKLIFIVVVAAVISSFKGRIDKPAEVFKVMAYLAAALVLILLQPDLGTGLVFIAITFVMLIVGGMKGRYFAYAVLVAVLATAAVLQFGLLADYQEDRLLVFVEPERDPTGAGYNLAQSKIAIGSGGLAGKGLGAGTQSNLHFIPARHTDFIFSVLGEELGFLGAVLLLGLFLALLVTALAISTSSRDLYGALISAGIIGMWLFQILENIGMTVGMMPITGIPLPFMSFGSSSMVTNLGAVGLLLSVWSRRYGT